MFRTITDFSAWLDDWLETNVGRPYNAILSVGLVLEMVNKIQSLPRMWSRSHASVGTLLALAMEAALLINQLGEFSHRRHARVAKAAARAGGPKPPGEHPRAPDPAPTTPPRPLSRLRRRLRR